MWIIFLISLVIGFILGRISRKDNNNSNKDRIKYES